MCIPSLEHLRPPAPSLNMSEHVHSQPRTPAPICNQPSYLQHTYLHFSGASIVSIAPVSIDCRVALRRHGSVSAHAGDNDNRTSMGEVSKLPQAGVDTAGSVATNTRNAGEGKGKDIGEDMAEDPGPRDEKGDEKGGEETHAAQADTKGDMLVDPPPAASCSRGSWYKFDDETVTEVTKEDAVDRNYGGEWPYRATPAPPPAGVEGVPGLDDSDDGADSKSDYDEQGGFPGGQRRATNRPGTQRILRECTIPKFRSVRYMRHLLSRAAELW